MRQEAHTTGPPFFSAMDKESGIFGLRWGSVFVNVFGTAPDPAMFDDEAGFIGLG